MLEQANNNKSTIIRRIADTYRISFKEAKFIYPYIINNQDESVIKNARLIYRIMEEYKIPEYIANEITWIDNEYNVLFDIYYTINKFVKNKEYKELGIGISYAEKLYPYLRNGISLDKAEEIIELKNKVLSIIINKPIELVRIMTIFNIKKNLAQTILDVCKHSRDNSQGLLGNYNQMIRSYLLYSKDLKTDFANGILIKSKTDNGLYNLKRMIDNAFNKGDIDFTEKLYNEAIKNQLVITDICFDNLKISNFNSNGLFIYIGENDVYDYNNEETIYHEATHFLDYINGSEDEFYSVYTEKIVDIYEQIKKELNNSTVNSIVNNEFIPNFIKREIKNNPDGFNLGMISTIMKHKFSQNKKNGLDYVNNEELQRKWKKEIDDKHRYESKYDRELYFEQKIYYEKQRYTRLIICIQDIYDGLTNGKAHDWFNLGGHGRKYYSFKENGIIEFIAEIGELYNADGIDLLEYELGKELTKKIINIYKDFLEYKNNEIEINNTIKNKR